MPTIPLARGVVDTDGTRHRDAVLVPPDGRLELALTAVDGSGRGVRPADRHRVLARCLERLGGYAEPDEDVVAALSRGDADQLALAVRREVLGPAVALVLRCANPACGQDADVDLSVDDLLADTTDPEPEWFVADAGTAGRVVLRPVTGADEAAVEAGGGDPAQRTARLMSRIVATVERPEGSGPVDPDGWARLPAPLRHAALLTLAQRPSAPTTDLQIACPSCGAVLEVRIDPLVLLARELHAGGDRLLVETHCLAFHYGWSEDAVLSLPRRRRWAYLALLRAQTTGAPLETAVGHG